jgi:hypothetical protein
MHEDGDILEMTMRAAVRWMVVALAFVSLNDGLLHGQAAQSPARAEALVRALAQSNQEAVAAADPQSAGTFIAALYTGTQLLVVSARHPATESLASRIAKRQYREAFLVLQQTPISTGKVFVIDVGADGLGTSKSETKEFDVMYEEGVRQTIVDGDFERQHLSHDAYEAQVAEADARYARMLTVLADALSGAQAQLKAAPHNAN